MFQSYLPESITHCEYEEYLALFEEQSNEIYTVFKN